MKTGIHPNYQETTVTCACGNTFTTRSTRTNLRTDLCNVCHPFYTGEQRIVDSAGQVERFMKRVEAAASTEAGQSKRQRRIAARAAQRGPQVSEDEETAVEDALEAAPVAATAE
jgi:large subunit ribosomal protein L31